MRQPILYADAMWRSQRKWVLSLPALGLVVSMGYFYGNHFRLSQTVLIWLGYVPLALLFAGGLLFYRRRHYVQVTDGGLRVSNLLSSVLIAYDLIRSPRTQPLERHFQEARRRLVQPPTRPLMAKPALFFRLRGEPEQVAPIVRKLGRRLAWEDTVALPVPDPDALAWEIASRLPERTGANLGGQRRRKRGR